MLKMRIHKCKVLRIQRIPYRTGKTVFLLFLFSLKENSFEIIRLHI